MKRLMLVPVCWAAVVAIHVCLRIKDRVSRT
ncbi:MAG: hypothetical protein JWN13_3824 [Betaproteobacteria bacterium]|nr:hypothetical protein [Betaproteobacteria bacterium]